MYAVSKSLRHLHQCIRSKLKLHLKKNGIKMRGTERPRDAPHLPTINSEMQNTVNK